PSALHIAASLSIKNDLLPSLDNLYKSLLAKSTLFNDVKKLGRTHLQDAVPMSLGQEFSGYASQIARGIDRMKTARLQLAELALGGTAVGTGLNTHPDFASNVIALISKETGASFQETKNHFEAQAAQDTAVETGGGLKTIAVSLIKISNDIRWLSSGPRAGLGEIEIPSLQPGSSIMPGKINPVIPESVVQVAMQVIGNDTTIMLAGQSGNFELNVTLPVIAYNLLQSITLISSACRIFAEKCIDGVAAIRQKSAFNVENSLALATHLVPQIGYDQAAAIAKKAHKTGKSIRKAALEENILPEDLLNRLLNGSG
ncbi:MAG: lyase family protein, partial [Desulfobacterales bacterium]